MVQFASQLVLLVETNIIKELGFCKDTKLTNAFDLTSLQLSRPKLLLLTSMDKLVNDGNNRTIMNQVKLFTKKAGPEISTEKIFI